MCTYSGKKMITLGFILILLFSSMIGCTAGNDDYSEEHSDLLLQLKQIIQQAENIACWYTNLPLERDTTKTAIQDGGKVWYPLRNAVTKQQLQQQTSLYFSKDFCTNTWDVLAFSNSDGYLKEFDGVLYATEPPVRSLGKPLLETAEIIFQTQTHVVLQCYVTHDDRAETLEPFIFVKENGTWRLRSYFYWGLEEWYAEPQIGQAIIAVRKSECPLTVRLYPKDANDESGVLRFIYTNVSSQNVVLSEGPQIQQLQADGWEKVYQAKLNTLNTLDASMPVLAPGQSYICAVNESVCFMAEENYRVRLFLDERYNCYNSGFIQLNYQLPKAPIIKAIIDKEIEKGQFYQQQDTIELRIENNTLEDITCNAIALLQDTYYGFWEPVYNWKIEPITVPAGQQLQLQLPIEQQNIAAGKYDLSIMFKDKTYLHLPIVITSVAPTVNRTQ